MNAVSRRECFGYWYTINWIIETNEIGLIEEKGRFNNNIDTKSYYNIYINTNKVRHETTCTRNSHTDRTQIV